MKSNRWAMHLVLLTLGLGLVLAMAGCGVKGPPVPPRSIPPAAITDLTFILDEDLMTLNWSIPTGKATGSAGLARFIIYRAVASLADPVCDGCPALFRRIAEVDLQTLMAGNPGRKTATFQQTIEKGYQYIFKVTAVSKDGQRGPDSNRVIVR